MTTSSTTTRAGENAPPDKPVSSRRRTVAYLEAYALVILLVLIAVFFTVFPETSSTFPTAANLRILVASQAVIGVVAIGALIPLIGREFDLSVGATAALSAILVAQVTSSTGSVLLGLVVALGIGAVVGAANALIVTRAGVNGVVATLGMSTILGGVILHLTGGRAVASDIPDALTGFGTGTVLGVPIIFVALLVVAVLVFVLLEHTPVGRQLYAMGSNPAAAALVGVRTRRLAAMVFVMGAVLCGIAGLLYVARAGGADPKLSNTFTLPALAAAFLSAASIRPGQYNVWGTMAAIYLLAVLNNGLNLAGAPPYMSDYLNGGALIIGVALAAFLRRRNASARR